MLPDADLNPGDALSPSIVRYHSVTWTDIIQIRAAMSGMVTSTTSVNKHVWLYSSEMLKTSTDQ